MRKSASLLAAFSAILLLPVILLAQGDSTVVVDKTGFLGPVIDHLWPALVALLASGTVWIITQVNEKARGLPEYVKWIGLYGFSLIYNVFARWVGVAEVDPVTATWGATLLLPAGQMGVAALIYKLSGHKPPAA